MMSEKRLLIMENISKSFGGTNALTNANFALQAGEIHALMGANGAGKSTLIKILCGVHTPDEGSIFFEGKKVVIKNPFEAQYRGIGYVPQEISVQPYLSVAENIFLGKQPTKGNRFIDFEKMKNDADGILKELGIAVDVRKMGHELSIAEKQIITIAKAISLDSKILIFDEATSALTLTETQNLFSIIRRLRQKSIGIIYVTHRMEEIFELCDQVTVFRDGKFVCTEKIVDINLKTLIKQMIGKEVSEKRLDTSSESSGNLLEVINFQLEGVLNDINFALKKGEILGIAGLVGSGRSELARAIFGDLKIDSGELKVLGKLVKIHNCHQAIKAGIAFVPEDRKTEGVIAGFSLRNNISMPILQRLRKFGLIFMNIESAIASKYLSELDVKYRSVSQKVSTLSGGNQQRVVLSKWLATNPRILIVDEPTRGIDVAAKADIHQILIDLSKKGIGILVISSELSELLQLTERILILRRGKIVDSVATNSTSVQELMELATGEIQVSKSEARND